MLAKYMKPSYLGILIGLIGMMFVMACGGEDPTPVPATSTPAPAAVTATEAPAAPAVKAPEKELIKFHDGQWGSNWVHLAIARYILENGYGYETEEVQGTTGTQQLTLVEGDVHVNMETWRMNIPVWYKEGTAAGTIIDLAGTTDPLTALPAGSPGQTVAVAGQGFYVPRYMIEGDAERGIEATAPDLKSVQDLRKYKDLFADPNDPDKGAVYNCILGWACQKVNRAKWHAYDMYTDFNVIEPGGSAALKAAIVAPYEAGEPFVSYYWQPTDVINLRDMVMLEEPKWNQECQDSIDAAVEAEPYEAELGCHFPISDTHTVVNAEFAKRQPQVIEFLTNYYVDAKPLAEAEAYKSEAGVEWVDVAIKYLRDHRDVWTTWITDSSGVFDPSEVIANVDKQLSLEAESKDLTAKVKEHGPACAETVKFHDGQWGSNWVHLAITRYILENGYGCETEEVQGTTGTQKLTLVEGDVHINMETWRMNIPVWYKENTANGKIIDLAGTTDPLTSLPAGSPGQTVAVAGQGFYVPAYMVNGDAERGIEATAPDLKTVQDLRKYKDLFADPTDPDKGQVFNCILGWECQKVNRAKWFAYDMYTDFNVIEPGGSAALKAAVVAPYEAGEPFVSYYWQPTDVINLRDMIMLEEPAWNQECQDATDLAVEAEPYESTIGCHFPISDTHTVVNAEFAERNPRVITFLTNYYVDAKPLAEAEAYKSEAGVEWVDVAIKYLRENGDVWRQWIATDPDFENVIANVDKQLALED